MNEEKNDLNNHQMIESAERAAGLLKQLANKHRLMLLCHLVKGEANVNQLIDIVGLSQSAISQHLSKLKAENLVASEKRGQQVFYRLASVEANAILSTLYLIYCRDNL